MKSIYPISTSSRAINCRANWKSAAVGVEYLFVGNGSRIHRQITDSNYDFSDLSIGVLNAKPQIIDEKSGRYRQRNTVPI